MASSFQKLDDDGAPSSRTSVVQAQPVPRSSPGCGPCGGTVDEEGEYRLALHFAARDEFPAAIAAWSRMLGAVHKRKGPMNERIARAHYNRGYCYVRTHQLDYALSDLSATIAFDARHVPARLSRSYVYLRRCLFELALADCAAVLALHADNVAALANAGVAEQGLGNLNRALDYYEAVLALPPSFMHDDVGENVARVHHLMREYGVERTPLPAVASDALALDGSGRQPIFPELRQTQDDRRSTVDDADEDNPLI